MIKGAIFDMDGTVLDSMPVWDRLSENYLATHGIAMTPQDYEAIEGQTQLQVAEYFINTYPQLPITAEQIVQETNALITERYEKIAQPKAGVLSFLKQLRKCGVRCAVATLTNRQHAQKALRDRHMLDFFEAVFTIEDVGVDKYEPDIYLAAAESLACLPAECMVFEDAPYAAETAKRAGFRVCGVLEKAYAYGEAQLRINADILIEHSFEEVQKVLFQGQYL